MKVGRTAKENPYFLEDAEPETMMRDATGSSPIGLSTARGSTMDAAAYPIEHATSYMLMESEAASVQVLDIRRLLQKMCDWL